MARNPRSMKGPPGLIPDHWCLALARLNQIRSPLLRVPTEMRSKISHLVMKTANRDWFPLDHFDWNRLEYARNCLQLFSETAAEYLELKTKPLYTSIIVPRNDAQAHKLISGLAPAQVLMAKHIKVQWGIFEQGLLNREPHGGRNFLSLEKVAIIGWPPSYPRSGLILSRPFDAYERRKPRIEEWAGDQVEFIYCRS
ncbi:hypothetical protein EK21DRAFT_106767 [Setomelanomma holmii]|uniref:Uncharacterized protein n=1 Tax=Setomelanomma holmii TaxID=210430 RepID=A0A9P4HKH0_9PLEO|nr:hypothetical protein EK21DRAFT_106767 [Setomelanomma holmii]